MDSTSEKFFAKNKGQGGRLGSWYFKVGFALVGVTNQKRTERKGFGAKGLEKDKYQTFFLNAQFFSHTLFLFVKQSVFLTKKNVGWNKLNGSKKILVYFSTPAPKPHS